MPKPKSPIDAYGQIALVLQGGGALGAYQAGAVSGLIDAGIEPTVVAGISIGALNSAIIAGNAPSTRAAALQGFWDTICTSNITGGWMSPFTDWMHNTNEQTRNSLSTFEAARSLFEGQKGFFSARKPLPLFPNLADKTAITPDQISYYTIDALRDTLLKYADFDRINSGPMQVTVGAVNIRTGNFVYFDNREITLAPEHFMASGALPPGFPAVKIAGEYYWDGGLVSNTPLTRVVDGLSNKDCLIFQLDVWRAAGELPRSFLDISERTKDIQFSSRTRLVTDMLKSRRENQHLIQALLDKIPASQHDAACAEAQKLLSNTAKVNLIHLIYQDKPFDGSYKDFEFSAATMKDHWASGVADVAKVLVKPSVLALPTAAQGFVAHDIHA